MKNLILTFSILFSIARAQTDCKSGIIASSGDIKLGKYREMDLKKMHHALWSDSIVVRTAKERIALSPEKVWGYRDKDCRIYRNYEDDFYKIEQADSIVVYTQMQSPFADFYFTFYYFSKNLDSPVIKLTKKNLEKEFKDNPCFLSRLDKEIKWYEDYSSIDRKKHIYRIIEVYRECVKK